MDKKTLDEKLEEFCKEIRKRIAPPQIGDETLGEYFRRNLGDWSASFGELEKKTFCLHFENMCYEAMIYILTTEDEVVTFDKRSESVLVLKDAILKIDKSVMEFAYKDIRDDETPYYEGADIIWALFKLYDSIAESKTGRLPYTDIYW